MNDGTELNERTPTFQLQFYIYYDIIINIYYNV
jgi:hypothetical protein